MKLFGGVLRRQHRYRRECIDVVGWPHPRPTRDPRLVCMNIGLAWASGMQIFAGPAPTSVQGQSVTYQAAAVLACLIVVSSILVLYSARTKSQWSSWGWELAGCIGFTGSFGLLSLMMVLSIEDWYSTTTAGWAIFLTMGNAIRAVILARRMW